MEATDQAAEQVVRITLAGGETAVRLTGAAAANVAAALAAAAASGGRTKGRARLQTMLRTGRELRVFQLPREQLGGFAREARRYGARRARPAMRPTSSATCSGSAGRSARTL